MRRGAALLTLIALASSCSTPSAEETLCAATLAMANEVRSGGEPATADIDTFIRAAAEVTDEHLRDPTSAAAATLATSPLEALDPLAAVFDRCVELGMYEQTS